MCTTFYETEYFLDGGSINGEDVRRQSSRPSKDNLPLDVVSWISGGVRAYLLTTPLLLRVADFLPKDDGCVKA